MKEQKLVYTEKSAKPNLLKILLWILLGDFVACILYGIAMGSGGSIDAQMNGAPAFLAELAVITTILTILFYRMAGKRITSISIYERTVIFSAPKVPMQDEDGSAEPEPAVPEAEPEAEPESEEAPAVKRENPYLRKAPQKKAPAKEAKSADESRRSGKRIGKVTHDIPNSEVECPVEQLRSASRKGKNVVLIMENGDRYLFVRMSGAARLVKVIEDKVAAEIQVS